jgi:hypothetical protein
LLHHALIRLVTSAAFKDVLSVVGLPSVILKSARNISRDCSGVVCVFSVKSAFPLFLKSLAPRAGGLKRCSRDSLLRCLGGGISRGDAVGVPWWALVGWWCITRGDGETRGLLSRFDCVYSDYITQGCPGGALAVAMSLRARCAFFPTHLAEIKCGTACTDHRGKHGNPSEPGNQLLKYDSKGAQ